MQAFPSNAVPADTTGALTPGSPAPSGDTEGLDEFNQTFREAVRLFLEGNWELMSEQLWESALSLSAILLPRLLLAGIAFLIFYTAYRLVDSALFQILNRSERVEAGLQNLLLKSYRVVAVVLISIIVLGQLGVDVTALVAGLSIAGIALGFAARDSLENFISGVTILVDEPFVVGDYIEVEDQYGQVDEITLRSTRIRTVRNEIMVLPNTFMITNRLINHTKRNTIRVDVDFGIAYAEYPHEARQVVLALCEDDDRILSTPSPTVVVTEMAASSVNMKLRFYLRDPSTEVPMRWAYTEKVREALREADIEIPFPHMQLFLDEAKGLEHSVLFDRPDAQSNSPSS
ncbi:mechanosensitive ion channel protein MscS [Longimonas halophila]|uniref:Mechanosensitive ion channel protein MscS n=1 Tax=Longimonas halophila TaxID=1469170 RepID=A0A2H3NPV8_9BACT|nr:mechanosensitive ion channel family protein [Longimonas halophila]PEN09227.1 mechanosensitive ion channel protein MscS [Longimonas halophila]